MNNDINKQYSENNNATFASFVTLIGSFLAVFSLYVYALPHDKVCCRKVLLNENVFLVTILVILVLTLLACLSAALGYERRRDNLVASACNPTGPYNLICSGGKDKCWGSFLVGPYAIFFWFFFGTESLFTVYSALKFASVPKYLITIAAMGGFLWISTILFYSCLFCRYIKINEKAKIYSANIQTPDTDMPTPQRSNNGSHTTKTINVNVNS